MAGPFRGGTSARFYTALASSGGPFFRFPSDVALRIRRHYPALSTRHGVPVPFEYHQELPCPPATSGRPRDWSLADWGATVAFRRHPESVAHIPLSLIILCEPDGELSELCVETRFPLSPLQTVTSRASRRSEGYLVQVFFRWYRKIEATPSEREHYEVDTQELASFIIENVPSRFPISDYMN